MEPFSRKALDALEIAQSVSEHSGLSGVPRGESLQLPFQFREKPPAALELPRHFGFHAGRTSAEAGNRLDFDFKSL